MELHFQLKQDFKQELSRFLLEHVLLLQGGTQTQLQETILSLEEGFLILPLEIVPLLVEEKEEQLLDISLLSLEDVTT